MDTADALCMTLEGLNLDKYTKLFLKRKVPFDTFINMTKEDLLHVGITDEADQEAIMKGTKPLKNVNKNLSDLAPPNLDAVLESNLNHIKALLGLMIVMKKKLRKEMLDDMILSESHTASSTFIHFLEKIDDEIKTIKDDITQLNTANQEISYPSAQKSVLYFIGFAAAAAATAVACLFSLTPRAVFRNVNRYWIFT